MRLMAMNDIATGMPANRRTVEPPRRRSEAICQVMITMRLP
jgi:hypothetical protein